MLSHLQISVSKLMHTLRMLNLENVKITDVTIDSLKYHFKMLSDRLNCQSEELLLSTQRTVNKSFSPLSIQLPSNPLLEVGEELPMGENKIHYYAFFICKISLNCSASQCSLPCTL